MKFIPHTLDRVKVHTNEGAYGGEVLVADNRAAIPYSIISDMEGDYEYVANPELQNPLETSKNKQVIALTADSRTGKTRVAAELAKRFESEKSVVVSFATALRAMARKMDLPVAEGVGWRKARQEAEDDLQAELMNDTATVSGLEEERLINDYIKTHYPGHRGALFNLSEAVKTFRPEFFVEVLLDEIDKLFSQDYGVVIIDDLRFPVEYEYLKAMLHDFTVYHLVSEEIAPQQATPTDGMRHDWRDKTGGATIVVPEGKSDEAISEAADKIIKHQHKPKQDQSQVFFAPIGASLTGDADWGKSVGVVSGDGIQLTDDTKIDWRDPKQASMTIDFDADEDMARLPYGIDNEEEKEEEQTELFDFTIRPQQLVVVQQDPELLDRVASLEDQLRELQNSVVEQGGEKIEQPDTSEPADNGMSAMVEALDKAAKQIAAVTQQPSVSISVPGDTKVDAEKAYWQAAGRIDTASWEDLDGEYVLAAEDAKQIIVSILEGSDEQRQAPSNDAVHA